jgi:hypothetical protein
MTTIGVQYVKSGEGAVAASKNMSEKATNLSELSLVELVQGLIDACDKEIASNNAKENT